MVKKGILGIIIFVFTLSIHINHTYALTPESNLRYEGIDVSNWQGYINYAQVKNTGIEIVYIKASQGTNIKDAYFEINYENAKANGLYVGFYHYLTAKNIKEAREEAEFFVSVISGKIPDCKLVLDYESFGNIGREEINNIARTFMERVEELTNKEVILYSDLSNARNTFDENLAKDYNLWIAYYEDRNRLNNTETSWNTYIRHTIYR